MKKFIFLLTALIFTFSFTSCNDDEELLNNDNEEPQEYIAPNGRVCKSADCRNRL